MYEITEQQLWTGYIGIALVSFVIAFLVLFIRRYKKQYDYGFISMNDKVYQVRRIVFSGDVGLILFMSIIWPASGVLIILVACLATLMAGLEGLVWLIAQVLPGQIKE